MTKARRLGRFQVTRHMIDEAPEAVRQVMAACVIVRAETQFIHDAVEYIALSQHFDLVPHGEIPPDYHWLLTSHEPLGQVSVKAQRLS